LRREAFRCLGGFEEGFSGIYSVFEDQAFLAKVFLNAPVYVTGECLDKYRLHPESLCAVQERDGAMRQIHAFYLKWLASYLSSRVVADPSL